MCLQNYIKRKNVIRIRVFLNLWTECTENIQVMPYLIFVKIAKPKILYSPPVHVTKFSKNSDMTQEF